MPKLNEVAAIQNTDKTKRIIVDALRHEKEYGARNVYSFNDGIILFETDKDAYKIDVEDYLVRGDDLFYSLPRDEFEKLYTKPKGDMVNHPSHYKLKDGLETIDVIKATLTEEEFIGFCKGNALKYQFRAGKKDQAKTAEDYEKAMFYLKEIIK